MLMSGFAGHINSWLAISCQEKTARFLSVNGYTGLPRYTRGIISTYTLQTGDLFLASDSEPTIYLMSGFAGHIDSWLATARQEKIDKLEKLNGYNFLTVTQSCEWGIGSL